MPTAPNAGRHEVALVLLAGLIAALSGLGGAYLGSRATIVSQREVARESRGAEARTKRATVYADFLDAAERYSAKAKEFEVAALKDFPRVRKGLPAEVDHARSVFLRTRNQVYIFGSRRGVGVVAKISRALPPALLTGGVVVEGAVDERAFVADYSAMLNTMCAEVSAEPRPTC